MFNISMKPDDMSKYPNQQLSQARPKQAARQLAPQSHGRNWLARLWSRPGRLINLAEIEATCVPVGHYYAGARRVPISQIRGSGNEGRCWDFDADFRPLKAHSTARWLAIATARQMGVTLPPVALIEIEGVYFVEDGHHRISVARAMGQPDIEATVTVWQVAGPLPWGKPVTNQARLFNFSLRPYLLALKKLAGLRRGFAH